MKFRRKEGGKKGVRKKGKKIIGRKKLERKNERNYEELKKDV